MKRIDEILVGHEIAICFSEDINVRIKAAQNARVVKTTDWPIDTVYMMDKSGNCYSVNKETITNIEL